MMMMNNGWRQNNSTHFHGCTFYTVRIKILQDGNYESILLALAPLTTC
jgi:hypothetical protein